jgi:hypothetical protein
MNERELLVDCLRRLNRTGVAYYLTGSMASNYWGIPRTTHDLDFVVQLPVAAMLASLRSSAAIFTSKKPPCAPRINRPINSTPLIPAPR